MEDKYLIINADDFGYNCEQNEAIKELLQKVNQSIQGIADASKVSEQTFNSLGERIILMENVLQEIQEAQILFL